MRSGYLSCIVLISQNTTKNWKFLPIFHWKNFYYFNTNKFWSAEVTIFSPSESDPSNQFHICPDVLCSKFSARMCAIRKCVDSFDCCATWITLATKGRRIAEIPHWDNFGHSWNGAPAAASHQHTARQICQSSAAKGHLEDRSLLLTSHSNQHDISTSSQTLQKLCVA